jgi:riboflavin synthase
MFTGLIEGIGRVLSAEPRAGGLRLRVDLGPIADGVRTGDSIALSGCCLTVVALRGNEATFEAVPETIARTWFGRLRAGDALNLERALRVGDRLGGHLVQGHVDGVARVTARADRGAEVALEFEAPAAISDGMVEKGSVALDGVSLTLTAVRPGRFAVALIPHTLAVTTLGARKEGDEVNVEIDILGKWVQKLVAPYLPPRF